MLQVLALLRAHNYVLLLVELACCTKQLPWRKVGV